MNLLLIFIASVLTIGTLAFKLQNNLKRWRADKPDINHGKEWALMALANIPSIVMFWQFHNYRSLAPSILMVVFFLWLFFDGLYNTGRHFNFWYTGTNDGKKDAFTDRMLRKLPLWLQVVIKLGGFVTFTILYYLWTK